MSSDLVERGANLFEFLARVQQLKSRTVTSLDSYERDGAVFWFASLPSHPAVRVAHETSGGEPFLVVNKVPAHPVPEVPKNLSCWVGSSDTRDPKKSPQVLPWITEIDESGNAIELKLGDFPETAEALGSWLEEWKQWAARELADRPVRELYSRLFDAYAQVTGSPEAVEAVLAVGCLAWNPPAFDAVVRHVLTTPVTLHFDADTGRLLLVRDSAAPLNCEYDMLSPKLIAAPDEVNHVESEARAGAVDPLVEESAGSLIRRLVNSIDPAGSYRSDLTRPPMTAHAQASYAPAIIVRKRSQRGLITTFRKISDYIRDTGEVPSGIKNLLDPDHVPSVAPDTTPGALVRRGSEQFLPLQLNDVQLRIVHSVNESAHTVVQGPPGTGKTHTAAALLTHLLAQGKRVLVTAKTDQALREVRGKLPEQIKPLSVAVVGSSRDDMSDLRTAVEFLSERSDTHDSAKTRSQEHVLLQRLNDQLDERERLLQLVREIRAEEVRLHSFGEYEGTRAALAQTYEAERPAHEWLLSFVHPDPADQAPLSNNQIALWVSLFSDDSIDADAVEAQTCRITEDDIPAPEEFTRLCLDERVAAEAKKIHHSLTEHAAFEAISQLPPSQRLDLQHRMKRIARAAAEFEARQEQWMNDALRDVRAGRARQWQSRANVISELTELTAPQVQQLQNIKVVISSGERAILSRLAQNLLQHIAAKGGIKVHTDGSPKIGAFSPKAVKESRALFDGVRVDGLPPTTEQQLTAVCTAARVYDNFDRLDAAWPTNVSAPHEDTLFELLDWHLTELDQLHKVLAFGDELNDEAQQLSDLGLPRPNWNDLASVQQYASLVDAATAHDAWLESHTPLSELHRKVTREAQQPRPAKVMQDLETAIARRDPERYVDLVSRLRRLTKVKHAIEVRVDLDDALTAVAPALVSAFHKGSASDLLPQLEQFEQAWQWAQLGTWLASFEQTEINEIQHHISSSEDRVRSLAEKLAATRAWDHAVSPQRMTRKTKADLANYVQRVHRYGKGTGKLAATRLAEVREAMDRCRHAVPVWIMPIYRIAEQLEVTQNMFDVVIVDEASQAGVEGTFLQYLAPKIVVIGDDKQVSPAAVGVEEQPLRDLALQLLPNDRYRAAWQDPKHSFFDAAVMRFGGRITLTEHRRCVPEIIGFSNRIAYEPSNIRLVPVRQYGADRLDPIKVVYASDGFTEGTTNKTNPVEAQLIVDQVVSCLEDPAYDGKTIGIVSLQGEHQAKLIEKLLLDRIESNQWADRELRCGDAEAFQGSERDVIFLSMVAAPGARIQSLTATMYVQRYNVAVSRAKDQLWLYHSVPLSSLPNKEDMRFQLLSYCYAIAENQGTDFEFEAIDVTEDSVVEPFDNLLEQNVYWHLTAQGYRVDPKRNVNGYPIDLVVVGGRARLAIECQNDTWSGPEHYESQLKLQRDLERSGWHFFRIRASSYWRNRSSVLDRLYSALDELGIAANPVDAVVAQVETPPEIKSEPETETKLPPESDSENAAAVDTEPQPSLLVDEYREFTGSVPHVLELNNAQSRAAFVEIIRAEGPVTGARLRELCLQAVPEPDRVVAAATLNVTLASASSLPELVVEDELGLADPLRLTFRMPDQPEAYPRRLGSRSISDVPPREIAQVMAFHAATIGTTDREALMRATLESFGATELTPEAITSMALALPLVPRFQVDHHSTTAPAVSN
ncbi:AAA family ATPase [Hoyosella rhizosphaerae]|uniref:ATPase AAA n=1 Tax=Hoyosella rhizosphaerae TaxID=1755582 RepID=A0A916UK27_9ACTN|nr:AAA domain-containing protein [Hoyosella rhizosphaerae]MBN4928283.1 AAA family ATPase [Hoyosella rhizosphaerae]GGC73803.1 ATPase AAA [Hoyosella rhizosphaerae]